MNNSRHEIAVVTGCSAGVGRAIARLFGARGARLGLISRNAERLETLKQEIEASGGQALVLPLDVADGQAVEQAAGQVEDTFGPIDIWVNNAMTTVFSPFLEMTLADYHRVTDVTYHGFVHGTMAALKRMALRNRGTIVQVGSALAYRAIPLQSAYCGAKHAIQGFTEAIRSELMHNKINVHLTMVQLPAMNTPQFDWCKTTFDRQPQPVAPIFQPEVAARAIYWAAHHRKREVILGGNTLVILWGNKFFPGLGDWYLSKFGYTSQMTDEPIPPDRPADLWETVPGPYGAHGRFDNQSLDKSRQWELYTRCTFPSLFVAAAGGLLLGTMAARRTSKRLSTG